MNVKVSVIMPTNVVRFHNSQVQTKGWNYLSAAISSVLDQDFEDWELILLVNGGGCTKGHWSDPRIRHIYTNSTGNVGKLKHEACSHARGEIIVELDHDDMLTRNALSEIVKVFDEDQEVGMVYSNVAEFYYDHPLIPDLEPHTYNECWGWKTRDFKYDGCLFKETVSFKPTPGSMRSVHFAPNHVRAWRRRMYQRLGGHDVTMSVADDHDLCARFYIDSKVVHIDKCLYLYRIHGGNTYLEKNALIQEETARVGAKYGYQLAEKWCDLNGWRRLDLCGGINGAKGYETVDIRGECDHRVNLDVPFWDFPNNSFGIVRAFDALEHLRNPIVTMNEIHRILKPGGILLSRTPSTDGRGAFADPTHVSFWNELSFRYYTDMQFQQFLPTGNCTARFQELRLATYLPDDPYYQAHNLVYVDFDAVAIKPGMERWPGFLGFDEA